MEKQELKYNLTTSLARMYDMKVFNCLSEFLQGELRVLYYLVQNSNVEINPSILSDKLDVSRSRITAALSTLRKKGYVTMVMSENDRRRMLVRITPEGTSLILEKQQNIERYFDVLVEGLGEENVMNLTELIELSIVVMNKKENQL